MLRRRGAIDWGLSTQHRLGQTLVRKSQRDDGGNLNLLEEFFAAMTAGTKAPLK